MKSIGREYLRPYVPYVMEVTLILVSVIVGLVLLAYKTSGQLSFVVGLMTYFLSQIMVIRYKLHEELETNRPAEGMRELDSAYRAAKGVVGPAHVFIQWIQPEINALATRMKEISQREFSIRENDHVDMSLLYDEAFKGGQMFRAMCPQKGIAYFRLDSGQVFLRCLSEMQRNGIITEIRRLFIVSDESYLKTDEFKRILSFHQNLGWYTGYITEEMYRTAIRGQLSQYSTIISSDSFGLYGNRFVCEADKIVRGRMHVKFSDERYRVQAYLQVFDAAYKHCTKVTPADTSGQVANFDNLYNKYVMKGENDCSAIQK